MATLLTRMTEHPLTAAELDNANADKRAPMWWNKFADTQAAWPCEWESCTGNCTESDRECLRPAEACSELGAEPEGRHRTSFLIVTWLAVRRWLI